MILIICAWIYLFLIILAIGGGFLKLISKLPGVPLIPAFGVFYQFWFGFVILIGLLQLFSLFLPIGNVVFIIVSLLAILFAVINFRKAWAAIVSFSKWLITPRGFLSMLIAGGILILVSYSANREILHADTYIYHFNAVKWAKEYPVVPGLANLHSRFGFNSSFFLFAAFTEIGPFASQSAHIALSFLMVVCLVHWVFIISSPLEPMGKRIFCLMTFLFLVIHSISQIDITSLSTDYPMAIVTLVFCVVLLDRLEHKILFLLPLSAVAFSFKLTGMLVIVVGIAILLSYFLRLKYSNRNKAERKAEIRLLAISFIVFGFIVAGFVIRNAVVSGWLLYPFPLGNLHLPWSVPKQYVLNMIDWIKSYPKIPGGASPAIIRDNSFFFWFTKWFTRFRLSMESNLFLVSILILLWSVFQVSSFAKFIYARLNILLVILFAAASILFWFVSAPDVRFGSVYFFILFAGSMVLLFEGSRYKNVLKVLICGIFIYQLTDPRLPGYYIDREPKLFTFPFTKPPKLVRVIGSPPDENPPLYLYMPVKGSRCGDSPLPCTPYAGGLLDQHRLIRQRVPGDLSKGFLPTK